MNKDTSLQTLVNDVILLARQQAKGKPARLRLSKDTEAMLLSIGEEQKLPETKLPSSREHETKPPEHSVLMRGDSKEENQIEASSIKSDRSAEEELACIAGEVAVCVKCPLAESRNNTVPGEGNPHARLVFVGEAPGADEDKSGRPFVGRAGQLLTDIIVKGMQMKREDVFICNVLKCRPPNNRTPNPDEVFQCEPYLLRQLDIIQPKVICALGAVAAQTLLKTDAPIRQLRGTWHNYHDIPLRVTYHPAYLLRSPGEKKKTWEDIQEVMRVLSGEVVPEI